MIRSGCARRPTTLLQSPRCTETPLPRVTKPMIGSPGTGVQHLASLTQTSLSTPLTTTPGSPRARPGQAGRRGGLGEVLLGALLAAEGLDEALDDARRR